MCGINGIASKEKINDVVKRVERMNSALLHRGPDAGNIEKMLYGEREVVIGQRRLSIIDISSRSDQPMWSNSGNSVLVFNGEIYNYQNLKAKQNYCFKTNSDTEVLLAGLESNGVDFLKKCNGMFAFAFYRKDKGDFLLGRDRMGIKPLYYYLDEGKFIFSSEIKGILNSGLIKAQFNTEAIDEYLGNRYIREPYTFFKNIYQLPAGCCLFLNNDFKPEIFRYWDLPKEFNMSDNYNEDDVYEKFKNEVITAIKRRMISDVPLGTYLSGGIDSSIISAICAMNMDNAINTYTIGFSELNEFSYAHEVADKYNTIHHEILMDNFNYFGSLKELISYKDSPLGVPNEIPLAIMSKELKKKITVVLSGEGADELMGGYGKIYRTPYDYKNVEAGCGIDFYNYFIDKYEYVPRELRDKYLKTAHCIRNEKDEQIKSEFLCHSNEENVFRFFHQHHVKGLLQRVDITTMYASVEARVPFLDHELIEFVYKEVPYGMKLKWNSDEDELKAKNRKSSEYSEILDRPKYLLRKMGLELLPENIVVRKKMGFPVPLNEWFSDLQEMAVELLKDSEWFNYSLLDGLIFDCKRNVRSGQLLWMFINIELFRRMYFEREWIY